MAWRCKSLLLEMASPDAIARLPASGIKDEAEEIWKIYFNEQQHSSLAAFMSHVLQYDDSRLENKRKEGLLVQVSMISHHCCIWDTLAFRHCYLNINHSGSRCTKEGTFVQPYRQPCVYRIFLIR